MDLGTLAALGLSAALVAVIIALVVRARRQEAARAEAARARGWRYEARPRGFTIDGGERVPWTLTVSRPQHGSDTTRWEAPAERIDGVVLVGPKLPTTVAGLDLGSPLAQVALRALLGDDAGQLVGARPVEVGSAALRERCTVLATSPALAEGLVDDAFEQALAGGPDRAAVLRWRDRVQVRVPGAAATVDELDRLIALGEALTRS